MGCCQGSKGRRSLAWQVRVACCSSSTLCRLVQGTVHVCGGVVVVLVGGIGTCHSNCLPQDCMHASSAGVATAAVGTADAVTGWPCSPCPALPCPAAGWQHNDPVAEQQQWQVSSFPGGCAARPGRRKHVEQRACRPHMLRMHMDVRVHVLACCCASPGSAVGAPGTGPTLTPQQTHSIL